MHPRSEATVANVYDGHKDDPDCLYVELMLQVQGEGYLPLAIVVESRETKDLVLQRLCELFSVQDLPECIGRPCTVLRELSRDEALGLEVDGQTVTIEGLVASAPPNVGEQVRFKKQLEVEIAWTRKRLVALEEQLARAS